MSAHCFKILSAHCFIVWGLLGCFCLLVRGQGDGVIGSAASRGASRSFFGCDKKVLSICSNTSICVLVFRDSQPVGSGTTTRKD